MFVNQGIHPFFMHQRSPMTCIIHFSVLVMLFFKLQLFAEEPEEEVVTITLGKAIERVLSANRGLANAYQLTEQANLQIVLSKGVFDLAITPQGDAGYVGGGKAGSGPTVGAGLGFYKKFALGTAINITPMVTKAAHDYQTSVDVRITQPLLRGMSRCENLAGIEAARYNKRSSIRNMIGAQLSAVLRAIQSVYDVKRLEEIVSLDLESYKRLKLFLEASKRKEKIGLADSLDVYRAEIEFKQMENGLKSSQDSLQDAKDQLKDLLSYSLDMPIQVSAPLEHHPLKLEIDEAIKIGLQYRQEMQQAQDQIVESRRLVHLAEKQLAPDLNLVIDYSSTGCDEYFTDAFCRARESRWGIGFSSASNLDRTAAQVSLQQSIYSLRNSERNIIEARNQIVLEIKRLIRSIQTTEGKMINLQEQIKSAQGGLMLARIKYQRGLGNNFDVIQAEKTLQSALISKISTEIDHIVSEYRLIAALGILGNTEQISICLK